MSNSQKQSLDENVVFLPVNTSSPEFLHSEKERQAVERLLSEGPEAFYSSVGTECSGCFLSPEEVSQITSWAQDNRLTQLQAQKEENEEDSNSEMVDFPSTYFPPHSDTPPPCLELGWPEKLPWLRAGSVTVHTSPPAEGEPPIREIIRRHLQKAKHVIAIVTDRLTDGTVIGDLHSAASRGVPVYIILNQRSIEEKFTLNRLRHPNMRVRVLGGKTFRSRTGRTAVGELKDKFILVDLETVIHGSYSLTWTDAHLHRQLITILGGPVVEMFDKEFRILFAASLAIPDVWRVPSLHVHVTHQLKDFSDLSCTKHFHLDYDITNPPSPPTDSILDWEAMGVVHRESPCDQDEEIVAQETPPLNHMLFEKKTPIMDGFTYNGHETIMETKGIHENTSPVTNNVPDKSNTSNNTQHPETNQTTSDRMKKVERRIQHAISKQLLVENNTSSGDRKTISHDDKGRRTVKNIVILSSSKRKEHSKIDPVLADENSMDESGSAMENTPSSRKPIILRMPQSESFSSLSDIMKRLHSERSAEAHPWRGSKFVTSEMSQSMMNLSVHEPETNHEERNVPGPKLNHEERNVPGPKLNTGALDPELETPALVLMRRRNDDIKSALNRTPKTFLPRDRPRSSSFALNFDWRSMTERTGKQD